MKKALRPFLIVALLLALVPCVEAAPPADAHSAVEASLWTDFLDQVTQALDAALEAVLPRSEGEMTDPMPMAESSEQPQEPTPESYPTIDPLG